MKILQITPRFCPKHSGGGTAVTYSLSKALRQSGHEISIYTSDFELDQDYINSIEGVEVSAFHSLFTFMTLHLTPGIIMEARKNLNNFDIIHMQSARNFQNIVVYYYAKKYGIPYVIDTHGLNLGVGNFVKRSAIRLFDIAFNFRIWSGACAAIAENERGLEEYKGIGIKQDDIFLIYPPYDFDEFACLPAQGHFRTKYNIKEKYIILFLGGLTWVKGVDFLIESFHKLALQRSDVFLVLAGTDWDGYKATLDSMIDKLKLSNKVLFTGFISGKDKLSALVDATIMVLPSRYEAGLAWSSLEAIACGTPIIVTKDTHAGEDVKRMDIGYLVEFGNNDELSNAIQYILNNQKEVANKTQRAKKYIIDNFSFKENIKKYESIYNNCVKKSRSKKV